jgi:jumonji domain-containing protein 2
VQSFFAWHVEDADLYSVNYLHWGAPKVWYCVPPSGKARFEQVAASMHPEAHRACRGFLRHKDILISPSVLRQFSVGYHMCKQNKGEYVVLNAAAYHSGFNAGFNTAEAVNFATEDWVEVWFWLELCEIACTAATVYVGLFTDGSLD